MKAEQPETMTSTGIERLQRWAAFSVKAHCNRDSFAADLLLYDKLIVPVPDDDAEYERWMGKGWQPDKIADTVTASAGRLLPVPWTAELRAQWKDGQARLEKLGEEVEFGYTGFIYASSAAAWEEIAKSINILPAEDRPKRKPSLLAGYQSAGEARVELGLSPLDPEFARSRTNPEHRPGGRSVDQVVAFKVRRLVHEPKLRDPGDAFEVAVKLADDPVFQQARQGSTGRIVCTSTDGPARRPRRNCPACRRHTGMLCAPMPEKPRCAGSRHCCRKRPAGLPQPSGIRTSRGRYPTPPGEWSGTSCRRPGRWRWDAIPARHWR